MAKIRLTKNIAKKKRTSKKEKLQKRFIFYVGVMQLVKIILIIAFFVYIYLWIKRIV